MKKITFKLLFCFSLFSVLGLNAQEKVGNKGGAIEGGVVGPGGLVRCSAVEYNESLRQRGIIKESKEEFEAWLAPKIAAYKARQANNLMNDDNVLTIPVVIHVIHDGDPVNTPGATGSENISFAQAASQIDVLNQDFRRIAGSPGAGTSGYGMGVDVEIQFCLAQQDPAGNPTDGVNRVNMGASSWSDAAVDDVVKPATIWDPEQYMNMWSVRFSDATLAGYAQFPSSSGLGGINTNGGPAYTDGVVSNYNVFGTMAQDDGSFVIMNSYDMGRTMTHEVGHWLGLRHIWGDSSSCSDGATSGDYVTDTPASSGANYDCDAVVTSCSSVDMVENYMDYTYDACMDTFTAGQKTRMRTVMENSPRRATLPTSPGCESPEIYDLDGAMNLINVINPSCSSELIPQVELRNWGNNTMTSATIVYYAEGENETFPEETYQWTGSLSPNGITYFALPSMTLESGSYIVHTEITNINNGTDERIENNSASLQTFVTGGYETETVHFELVPDYYASEITWKLEDENGNVLYNGGGYSDGSDGPFTEVFEVNNGICYTFTINDSYGDGICCAYGNGYFELRTAEGELIYDGSSFIVPQLEVGFQISGEMSTPNHEILNGVSVYPNPAAELLTVAVENNELPSHITVYNLMGQVISETKITTLEDLNLNVSAYSSGIYFVKVEKDNKTAVLKFIKK